MSDFVGVQGFCQILSDLTYYDVFFRMVIICRTLPDKSNFVGFCRILRILSDFDGFFVF